MGLLMVDVPLVGEKRERKGGRFNFVQSLHSFYGKILKYCQCPWIKGKA
jgi:hypothetical protein